MVPWSSISVPPPVAFRYAPGSRSWTAVWGAKTADGYTPGKPGAAVVSGVAAMGHTGNVTKLSRSFYQAPKC